MIWLSVNFDFFMLNFLYKKILLQPALAFREDYRPMRLGWAKLLKRVFDLDLTRCQHCGGDLRMVAAILQRQAIEKILNHLGLDPQPPPRAPARGQMAF
jgi:hypothetical protein